MKGVPLNATRSLDDLVRYIPVLEADGIQNSAVIISQQKQTNCQSVAIYYLLTQVEKLELVAFTQSSVDLAAFQDDLNALCREINLMKEASPYQPLSASFQMGDADTLISIVSSSASPFAPGGFKPTFK